MMILIKNMPNKLTTPAKHKHNFSDVLKVINYFIEVEAKHSKGQT